VAKNGIEGGILKRQLPTVGHDAGEVFLPDQGRGAASRHNAALFVVDAHNSAVRNRPSQTQRDGCFAAPAIEDDHVRPKVREEKAGVDFRTARLERSLHLTLRLRLTHRKPIANASSLDRANSACN
jgi:hypothetical protein